ncbi:hypothetical protein PINS_up020163 [Pythium insidiosum]|nr:hypothetical protein PINS_up020163 [Pythium insidiosum]
MTLEIQSAYDPNSWLIQTWHQVLLASLLYELFVLPFLATFKATHDSWMSPEFIVLYACELLFVVDIYVEVNTGYYEDGNVTLDAAKARSKYFRSKRFIIDALALVPWSLLLRPANLSVAPVFLEFHKFLRVNRIPRYVAALEDVYARYYVLLKMFKVLLVILSLSHYVACIRFLFGYDEHHSNHWLPKVKHDGGHGHPEPHYEYLMSLFWAFGLLTGLFEGELPHTFIQFAFTIFVALCGFSLFTYLCATYFMISKCESGHVATAEARINQLKYLLSFHHVPENLQAQAIEYLKRYYTHSESNDREAMRLLCPSISKDIQVALLKDMVGNIIFFKDCNRQFIMAVTSLLELVSLPAGMVVFSQGDEGDSMYLVNAGVLYVLVNGVKIRELRRGAFFGEMGLFLRRPRYGTIVTTTYCSLYKLVRFHVDRLFEGYPQYSKLIPERVMDMARVLFGRPSGEILMLSDPSLSPEEPEERKTLTSLIRKHIIKAGVAKVAPALSRAPSASSLASVVPTTSKAEGSIQLQQPKVAPKSPSTSFSAAEMKQSFFHDGINGHKSFKLVPTENPGSTVSRRRSSATGKITRALQDFYTQLSLNAQRKKYWWSRLLLPTALDAESRRRMWWLFVMQLVLMYNWFIIPLQLAFAVFVGQFWLLQVLNVVTDLVLWIDIYVSMNLSFVQDSEKIWDTTRSAIKYVRGWCIPDILCALPYAWFVSEHYHAVARIPRLLRVLRLSDHFREADDYLKFDSKRRLVLFGILLVVLYHIVACLHFSTTYLEGFSESSQAWIPSKDVYLAFVNSTHVVDANREVFSINDPHVSDIAKKQYFRSLYYATNVLAALGLTIEPASDTQYGLALMFMLSGFFITATVVDHVQKHFTASAFEQKEFFATRSHIQLFLRRQDAPLVIHKRVNAFLDYWWSSHRGALIRELVEELPEAIKKEIIQSICQPALQTLALLNGVRPVLEQLEQAFLDNIKFVLYGQGETVYRQGDFASGLFFLLQGEVSLLSAGGQPRVVPPGGFFGTAALRGDGHAVSYGERVTATSGCVTLFVSREQLHALRHAFPAFESAMCALELRFLDPKLSKSSTVNFGRKGSAIHDKSRLWRAVFDEELAFDPDSMAILAWETWLFVAMTVQSVSVILFICFGRHADHSGFEESILGIADASFLVDIYIRSRLGYFEFGNKVMSRKMIKARYFRSADFLQDIVALLPLYAVGWCISRRVELLNINKLVRLAKVPKQFTALENKYVKWTLELRLFKLVYYTFLLSHILGCLWFDFASNSSGLHGTSTTEGDRVTHFGEDLWLPPASMENASLPLQYFESIFWSFGVMSASITGSLPKTVPQCIFNVLTMTCGFFLFAYVIGNFSDMIELMDAENRDFYAKLNSLRHLLTHFQLPAPIEDKFKTYFFFKRYHSITQEHLLERCLPPSLLTDIRMIHLQPMIAKVSFLSGMDPSVTRMLVSQFSQLMVVKDEYVYKLGDDGSDMFFVFTGVLDTLVPQEAFLRDASMLERKHSFTGGAKIGPDEESASAMTASSTMPPPSQSHLPKLKGSPSELTKLNEIRAGSYFGENALFFHSVRTSYVQARTSCVLYRLSRQSLELVFDRYPEWKAKVLRIMTIQQELQRLNRLAMEEENESPLSPKTNTGNDSKSKPGTERTDEELQLLRRMKSMTRRRKTSRSTRELLDRTEEKSSALQSERSSRAPKWLRVLWNGMSAQSSYHLFWLKLMSVTTVFIAVVIPYRIAFDSIGRKNWLPVVTRELEILAEAVCILDIWINWRLKGSDESLELYEQDHQLGYKKERLKWDLLAAFPLDYLLSNLSPNPWYRTNRCLKLRNLMHYMSEINRCSIYNEMHRLRTACLLYGLGIYWVACAYFVISTYDSFGDGWDGWRPAESLELAPGSEPSTDIMALRLLRALFFGTTAFVKKGRTFTPVLTSHFVFTIVACFVGLLVMAFMIGEIASLFISYIHNEVEYRKNHIAVGFYLSRWRIHGELKSRTQAFLSSLWSSHRGVDYQSLLKEVPLSIRTESIQTIASWPLNAFIGDIFRSIFRGFVQEDADTQMIQLLAQRLQFEGYPRGENVIVEGSVSKAMYFVVRGHLHSISRSQTALYSNLVFSKGDYFGERGLLGFSVSSFTVRTVRACDLMSLSSEALVDALHSHPTYSVAYKLALRASERVKALDLLATTRAMEQRWGEMLYTIVRDDATINEIISNPIGTMTTRKLRGLIDSQFSYRSVDQLFVAFQGLLQIMVANGMLHLHGQRNEPEVVVPSAHEVSAAPGQSSDRSSLPGLVRPDISVTKSAPQPGGVDMNSPRLGETPQEGPPVSGVNLQRGTNTKAKKDKAKRKGKSPRHASQNSRRSLSRQRSQYGSPDEGGLRRGSSCRLP